MSWHFRVRRRMVRKEVIYDIVEYFPKDGKLGMAGWTELGVTPEASSRKDLIKVLTNMLKDAERYTTFTDKENE